MPSPLETVIENFDALEQLVKREVALTGYVEMTQDQVNRFADLTFDRQWIHVDPERAKAESPFHGTISHGFFNLSMAGHFLMSAVKIRGVQYGLVVALNYARFLSAVPVGSLVRGRIRLMQCERLKDSNQAVWMITIERKGGMIPACVVEIVVRYYG
ncbi:MAG: MaoC family dehydratase [Candidatus Solibacter sp.]|jgi:acyl dehydratase